MSYDTYKTYVPDDGPHWSDQGRDEMRVDYCSDCGAELFSGGVTVPVDERGRVYCRPCASQRERISALFDPRPWLVIAREVA